MNTSRLATPPESMKISIGSRCADKVHGALIGVALSCTISYFCGRDNASSTRYVKSTSPRYLRENEEDVEEEVTVSALVLCIFLVLVMLTMGFDILRENYEERAGRHMRPIIASLFGELTVLGFLSAVTYVFQAIGLFEFLSEKIFHSNDEEEMLELFEKVHFSLFFVMLCFVIQVLEEVNQGRQQEAEWLEMDRACRDPSYVKYLLDKKDKMVSEAPRGLLWEVWNKISPYMKFLPQMRNKEAESLDDKLLFYALREEFIKERDVEPPFAAADPKYAVGQDFNFGRYLSVCFGLKMAHVVEIDTLTWLFYALLGSVIFGLVVAFKANFVVLSWLWCSVGYFVFMSNVYLEKYLLGISQCFVTPPFSDFTSRKVVEQPVQKERKMRLVTADTQNLSHHSHEELPAWCYIDLDRLQERRSWVTKMFSGNSTPNRQHALFWMFESNAPRFHMLILRINLVFNGMYCAMLALVFFPCMYKKSNTYWFYAYLVASAIPILAIIYNKKHLISTIVQVGSIGSFRLPQAVSQTHREEKTVKSIRTLVVLYKLARLAEFSATNSAIQPQETEQHYNMVLDQEDVMELSKTFDMINTSGEAISGLEFQAFMVLLGKEMDDSQVQNFVKVLGSEEDGEVSKDRFLQWYASQVGQDDHHSVKDCAHFLFNLFDEDGNGDISVSEFKKTLDCLGMGFTVDEVGEIVNELDSNANGVLGLHEFERLCKLFYPKELLFQQKPWDCVPCNAGECVMPQL